MRERLLLCIVTLTIGYACFAHGGVTPREWGYCMIAIAAGALLLWFPYGRGSFAPLPHPVLSVALVLVPVSVALQLVPLPVSWLEAIDPPRAELAASLSALGPAVTYAPFSVAPSITFAHLERVLAYLTMFFMARELSWRLPARRWLPALPIVVVGTAEAVLGLAQYFGGAGRASGTWVNPNHFASAMHMAFPFAAMPAVRIVRRMSFARAALSCLLMICAAAILFGAIDSLSRMGLATVLASCSLLAGAGVLTTLRGPLRWLAPAAPLAILSYILIAAPGPLWDRFSVAQGGFDVTAEVRTQFWKEAIRLAEAYPVFGCGLGTYRSAIQQFRDSAPLGLVEFAHNDSLQIFAEMGVAGSIAWVVSGVWIFLTPWRAAFARRCARHRLLAIACGVSLAALALDSLVDFNFYIPANMLMAAWIAGLGSALNFRRPASAGASEPAESAREVRP
jgi:O-antigen ligase